MAHWNSRGLRGSSFEEIINFTNERYRQSGLALFQKIPTPITPVRMDEETRTITLAYFEKQSTVDYIGVFFFTQQPPGIPQYMIQNREVSAETDSFYL